MIKIEFNGSKNSFQFNDFYTDHNEFNYPDIHYLIKKITFGCVSELVPTREEVLKRLNITPEQDNEMQERYKLDNKK